MKWHWPKALNPYLAESPIPASACEPHREWITQQVRLGRNAVGIYQDLVDSHGFAAKYNSVKRFVAGLKGAFVMKESDRIYNPSRQNALLLGKIDRIGPSASALARTVFATQGRTGMKMMNGLSNLVRDHASADIDAVCQHMMANG